MPRGPRSNRTTRVQSTPERSLKRAQRKLDRVEAQTHGGYAGPSLIEILEGKLLGACLNYLAVKDEHEGQEGSVKIGTARGIVRGMAEGVATMRNPYTTDASVGCADGRQIIKTIEREFMREARTAMSTKE